jgi:hypothetical protein
MPVEKLQNVLLTRHRALFRRVVGSRNGGWLAFLKRHADTFVVFTEDSRGLRRVRVVGQSDWQAADEREAQERTVYDQHMMAALMGFVAVCNVHYPKAPAPTLDDFIQASPMPSWGMRPPHRGDLVRLIRRYRHLVHFDRETYQLSLVHPRR